MHSAIAKLKAQHARGAFPGGQLCIIERGNVVANEAIGIASGLRTGEARIEVTPETRFGVFSCSKPFVAMAIALLEDRGLVDVRAPLSRYVPEWRHDRSVLDVLTHRAGILLPATVSDAARWHDAKGIVRAIAQAQPRYSRGVIAYAPYEFGWILSEIVQRVTNEPLPIFLERELLAPLAIDVTFTTTATDIAKSYWIGGKRLVAGVELSHDWEAVQNDPTNRTALVPGAGLFANASALAKLYAFLLDGGRGLIRPQTLRAYTSLNASGYDRSNKLPLRLGRGFVLGSAFPSLYGWLGTSHCFGHAGAFCSLAGADPKRGIALAYVTNGNRGPYDLLLRAAPLW